MATTPRAAVQHAGEGARLPDRPGEHFHGFGVMGLPFASGHYLAMRRFPTTSMDAPYHSVWHRDPDGCWTFYADTVPGQSCARYFDAALRETRIVPIALDWPTPDTLTVRVEGILDWTLRLGSTPATRFLTGAGSLLPAGAWRSPTVLGVLGRMAGPMLHAGRLGLTGTVPNGQAFVANPRRLWAVTGSTATLRGHDLGRPGPLPAQTRLGDFWLPQCGILAVGEATFEEYDAGRHLCARPARQQAG